MLTLVTLVRFGMHFHTLATIRRSSYTLAGGTGREGADSVKLFRELMTDEVYMPMEHYVPHIRSRAPFWWPLRIRDSGRPIGIYRPGLITEFYNTGLEEYGSTLSLFAPDASLETDFGRAILGELFLSSEDPERVAFDDEYKNG